MTFSLILLMAGIAITMITWSTLSLLQSYIEQLIHSIRMNRIWKARMESLKGLK